MLYHEIKLELKWIGKENQPKLEPLILISDTAKSYHALFHSGENDLFDNRLIFGDNHLALKALEQEFGGTNPNPRHITYCSNNGYKLHIFLYGLMA